MSRTSWNGFREVKRGNTSTGERKSRPPESKYKVPILEAHDFSTFDDAPITFVVGHCKPMP